MSLIAPWSSDWPDRANGEILRWTDAVPGLLTVHHIGSTSVLGLPAKPIIDLMPVFADDASADAAQEAVQSLGYEWMGALGLPGRRYARRFDSATGVRLFHAHGYALGHPDIARHLAFRDVLRDQPALRVGYAAVKAACAARHPDGGPDYGDCKSAWIRKVEARALKQMT